MRSAGSARARHTLENGRPSLFELWGVDLHYVGAELAVTWQIDEERQIGQAADDERGEVGLDREVGADDGLKPERDKLVLVRLQDVSIESGRSQAEAQADVELADRAGYALPCFRAPNDVLMPVLCESADSKQFSGSPRACA